MGERRHEANQILCVLRPERAIHFVKYKMRERVQRGKPLNGEAYILSLLLVL